MKRNQILGMSGLVALTLFAFGGHAFGQTQPPTYTVIDLGTLGGGNSTAYAINSSGQVVGVSDSHAFLYSAGVMHDLGTFGGGSSTAYAVNSSGQVVGWATGSTGLDSQRAFLYSTGPMQSLGSLFGRSDAYGINDSQQIVGWTYVDNTDQHGFSYSGGSMQDFSGQSTIAYAINNSGQIVGESEGSTHSLVHENT